MKISFDCGCSFNAVKNKDTINSIDFSINDINLECSKTWELISEGNTKGVFQLESRLGQSMAKKLKPENIEQLSALISIMRPGCLEAFRDGKSVSNHFIDKKNGLESVDYFHPSLEPILKNTYGEMVYQEQAMEIAKDIAGFDLQEADMLRKAIGKKKPEEMAKIKIKFIEGCKDQKKVSETEAEQIFSWIEKSQRYSFNKSHAVSYAINAYLSAFTKAHFPMTFFLSYLRLAKDKIKPQEEMLELIVNAKSMGIDVNKPNMSLKNKEFIIDQEKIYFGLTNIKNVGDSVFEKLYSLIQEIDLTKISWLQTLLDILLNINSASAKSLILSGAMDYLKMNRNLMLHEFNMLSDLTTKEIETCKNIISEKNKIKTIDLLKELKTTKVSKPRQKKILSIIEQLANPSYSLIDTPEWISDNERELLGASITCSKTDAYDSSYSNTDCLSLGDFSTNKQFFVVAEIDSVNVIKTKRGKNPGQEMCFIKLSDAYGTVDCVVFPQEFEEYKSVLNAGRVLMFNGQKSKKDNTPVIKKCFVV
jgi:DNA polymerase-3 subunit alpha